MKFEVCNGHVYTSIFYFADMPYFITFTLCLVLISSAYCQELAQDGYLVLSNGDTLHGQVQRLKETFGGVKFLNKIRYWDAEGKRKKYARSRIAEYKVGNEVYRKYRLQEAQVFSLLNSYYQIVPYGGEETFLRVLKEGPLCLYEYEWIDGTDDYISSFPLFKRADEKMMVRATQGIFGLKKKVLRSYFSDCPELQRKLESGFFKLPFEVVNYYNTQCESPH